MLDRKEALLTQLRTMNDEAEAGMHLDSSGRHTEAFQAAYAKVVLELKQARSQHLIYHLSTVQPGFVLACCRCLRNRQGVNFKPCLLWLHQCL